LGDRCGADEPAGHDRACVSQPGSRLQVAVCQLQYTSLVDRDESHTKRGGLRV
jgi:hypothetical protein